MKKVDSFLRRARRRLLQMAINSRRVYFWTRDFNMNCVIFFDDYFYPLFGFEEKVMRLNHFPSNLIPTNLEVPNWMCFPFTMRAMRVRGIERTLICMFEITQTSSLNIWNIYCVWEQFFSNVNDPSSLGYNICFVSADVDITATHTRLVVVLEPTKERRTSNNSPKSWGNILHFLCEFRVCKLTFGCCLLPPNPAFLSLPKLQALVRARKIESRLQNKQQDTWWSSSNARHWKLTTVVTCNFGEMGKKRRKLYTFLDRKLFHTSQVPTSLCRTMECHYIP